MSTTVCAFFCVFFLSFFWSSSIPGELLHHTCQPISIWLTPCHWMQWLDAVRILEDYKGACLRWVKTPLDRQICRTLNHALTVVHFHDVVAWWMKIWPDASISSFVCCFLRTWLSETVHLILFKLCHFFFFCPSIVQFLHFFLRTCCTGCWDLPSFQLIALFVLVLLVHT